MLFISIQTVSLILLSILQLDATMSINQDCVHLFDIQVICMYSNSYAFVVVVVHKTVSTSKHGCCCAQMLSQLYFNYLFLFLFCLRLRLFICHSLSLAFVFVSLSRGVCVYERILFTCYNIFKQFHLQK